MVSGKKSDESRDEGEVEPREFSSPACLLHEFDDWAQPAANTITIYHNPGCSKSRETLALILASGVSPRVVEYLKTPPSEAELTAIARKLGVAPAELVRTGESVFQERFSGKFMNDADWIKALVANPILLQRPIVVRGDAAVIGRPPENVQRLLK